jgi:hypothetical protein
VNLQVVRSLQEEAHQSKVYMVAGALVHQALTLAIFYRPAGKCRLGQMAEI